MTEMSSQYMGKVIVAPMVRICTLPFRLMAIDYGADLVYSEEIIDFKMLRSIKRENKSLGTVDFIDKTDGTIFFRTCEEERRHVVFQLGTSDEHRALIVAKMIEPYVVGLDINMGCPKEFSINGGMGAALLTQPEKVKLILTSLVKEVKIPITCKIRLLRTLEETIEFCKMVELCGVAAIAIHGRRKEERPNDKNHSDLIREVASSLHIPVIANGGSKEIKCYSDIEKFRQETGASSVMVARAVMWNCSLLRPDGYLPIDDIIVKYLKYCVKFDNPFTYTKYAVQNMLRELQETIRGKAFLETQTLEEICGIWDLKDYFKTQILVQQDIQTKTKSPNELFNGKVSSMPPSIEYITVIRKCIDGQESIEIPMQFIRGNYNNADLPKMLLNTQVYRNQWSGPKYSHIIEDRFFSCSVMVDGILYRSTLREKSRRYGEQAAALVCLHALKLVHETYGFIPADGSRPFQHVFTQELERIKKTREKNLDILNILENKIGEENEVKKIKREVIDVESKKSNVKCKLVENLI